VIRVDVSHGRVTLLPALRPKGQPGMLSGGVGVGALLAVENRTEDAALEGPGGSRSQEARR